MRDQLVCFLQYICVIRRANFCYSEGKDDDIKEDHRVDFYIPYIFTKK